MTKKQLIIFSGAHLTHDRGHTELSAIRMYRDSRHFDLAYFQPLQIVPISEVQ